MSDRKIKKFIMSNEEVIDYLENGLKCSITKEDNGCNLNCSTCELNRDNKDIKMAFRIALEKIKGISNLEQRLKESISISEREGLNHISNGYIIALSIMLEEGLIGEKAE